MKRSGEISRGITGGLIIFLSTLFVTSVFIFPAVHSVLHELGHAAIALHTCKSEQVSITLGDEQPCGFGGTLSFCIHPSLFYNSVFRNSKTFAMTSAPSSCVTSAPYYSFGGFFGILFSGLLVYTIAGVFVIGLAKMPLNSLFVPWLMFLFDPTVLISLVAKNGYIRVVSAVCAMVIQVDLINDFYSSFFPSRLITYHMVWDGDGTRLWQSHGYSDAQINTISQVVFGFLVVSYLMLIRQFVRFLSFVQKDK